MSERPTEQGLPWLGSALWYSPVLVVAAAAGAVGPWSPPGLVLLGVATVGVVIHYSLIWRPSLERGLAPNRRQHAESQFLAKASEFESIEEIAQSLQVAVAAAFGPVSTALLIPDPVEGIRVVAPQPVDDQRARQVIDELSALDKVGVIDRSMLTESCESVVSLMDELEFDFVLVLRQRALMLGVVFVSRWTSAPQPGQLEFLKSLQVYATASIANVLLLAQVGRRRQAGVTLGLANAIQESLMPQELPVRIDQFELRGLFRPVAACGGDLWAWRQLSKDKVLLLIGDATGHGAAPALLSAVAKGCIDGYVQVRGPDLKPGELLAAMNDIVLDVGRKHYLLSAFAAVVDVRAHRLTYANAAMNFPYLVGDGRLKSVVARGNPLGGSVGAKYSTHERDFPAGTTLFLYTDGVVEARNPSGQVFGDRTLRQFLIDNSAVPAVQLPGKVFEAVERVIGVEHLADDVTMVAFQHGESEEPVGQ